MPTLAELHAMQHAMQRMEEQAKAAKGLAVQLRACGGKKTILDWHRDRTHYDARDYGGIVALLEAAMTEFSPAILEILAARQELIAHEAMTQAVLKRAELGTFVSLGQDGSAN